MSSDKDIYKIKRDYLDYLDRRILRKGIPLSNSDIACYHAFLSGIEIANEALEKALGIKLR